RPGHPCGCGADPDTHVSDELVASARTDGGVCGAGVEASARSGAPFPCLDPGLRRDDQMLSLARFNTVPSSRHQSRFSRTVAGLRWGDEGGVTSSDLYLTFPS